jgi:hypothetical protein
VILVDFHQPDEAIRPATQNSKCSRETAAVGRLAVLMAGNILSAVPAR